MLDFCKSKAREGHWLWVVLRNSKYNEDIRRLAAHGNIKLFFLPKSAVLFYSLFVILKKQKKRIEEVYVDRHCSSIAKGSLHFLLNIPVKTIP